MGKLSDVPQRLAADNFYLSKQCKDCPKKAIAKTIAAEPLKEIIPAILFGMASPLAVVMHKALVPKPETPVETIEVFVFYHCQDYPCLIRQLHDIVSLNFVMDLHNDYKTYQRAQSSRKVVDMTRRAGRRHKHQG